VCVNLAGDEDAGAGRARGDGGQELVHRDTLRGPYARGERGEKPPAATRGIHG
jgi:hypothetical protein